MPRTAAQQKSSSARAAVSISHPPLRPCITFVSRAFTRPAERLLKFLDGTDVAVHNVAPLDGGSVTASKVGLEPETSGEAATPAPRGRVPTCQGAGEDLRDFEKHARQGRLLTFIDSCEPRVEELLNQAVQAGGDPADCIALLSDGTVLPPFTDLVARSEVADKIALLRAQVSEPLLHDEWERPTPGTLLAIALFEGVQAVSVFTYSVLADTGAQA